MKCKHFKKAAGLVLATVMTVSQVMSVGISAKAANVVTVAPENMVKFEVVDQNGNPLDGVAYTIKNSSGKEVAKFSANGTFSQQNNSGITSGLRFTEPLSVAQSLVAPAKLESVRQDITGGYVTYSAFEFTDTEREHTVTLRYLPVKEADIVIEEKFSNMAIVYAGKKWENSYVDYEIEANGIKYAINDLAGEGAVPIPMAADGVVNIYADVSVPDYTYTFQAKAREYIEVHCHISEITDSFNEKGVFIDERGKEIPIASNKANPGESLLVIVSGAAINFPVPDADGYIDFFVERSERQYEFFTDHYGRYTENGVTHYWTEGGTVGEDAVVDTVEYTFKAVDFPTSGEYITNVPSGTYTINVTSVPSGYEIPSAITMNVQNSQSFQNARIVVKQHVHSYDDEYDISTWYHRKQCTTCDEYTSWEGHNYGNTYKTDENNHWYECICGDKNLLGPHTPGPAATEQSAQTCTECGYEIAPKLTHSHSYGNDYEKDANNHWYECACGDKKDLAVHTPGPAATEEAAQTCTVCGYEIAPKLEHSHSYGNDYEKDADNHWYECACGDKKDLAVHTPGPAATEEAAQTCTVCGYEIAPKLEHSHSYGNDYEKDADNHWKECACGDKKDLAAHTPGPAATEEAAQTCTVCGYEIAPKLEHSHSYANDYESDADNHWYECACGDKKDLAAHTPGAEATETTDQVCTVCGYVITPALGHQHSYGSDYENDADNHWYECACGDKKDLAAHIPGSEATEENAQTCTVCGYEIAPKLTHTHSYGSDYETDANNHWKECACGDKADVTAHTPGPEATEESAQTCIVCGYEIAPKLTHTHSYSNTYKTDANNHWKACTCGDKTEEAAHSFEWVIDKDATVDAPGAKHEECSVCAYEKASVEIPQLKAEDKPVVDDKPIEEDKPVVDDTPDEDDTPVVEDAPVDVDDDEEEDEDDDEDEEEAVAPAYAVSPKTAEDRNLWACLFAAFVLATGMATYCYRKENKQ